MSYAILVLALAEMALLVWALRRWFDDRSNIALLLMLFIIVPVCLDSFTIGSGRWIGFGDTLEAMNRIRFTWFIFSMPLMLAISVAILGNAGFRWARQRWLLSVLIIAAIAVGGYEAIQAWPKEFHPACALDIKRYVFQVPAGQECNGSMAGDGTFGLPLIVPVATLSVVLMSIVLWWKRSWPWLALCCALVVVIVNLPQNVYTTFLSYPFDGLLTATMTLAAARLNWPVAPTTAAPGDAI
jgi:hypothetical protein